METKQVKFHIVGEEGFYGGILINNRYLICGCCGGVYDLEQDEEFEDEVVIDEYFDFWVPLSEYILD